MAGFWRCGPHRAKFLAETLWDLKSGLEKLGNGLAIRVGHVGEVAQEIIDNEGVNVGAVWMTNEEAIEERDEESAVRDVCEKGGVEFKLWVDEKYLIDEYDFSKLRLY